MPFRDEKIIASWNGFAIRALADAGALFGRGDYLDTARRAAAFLLDTLRASDDGPLLHSWTDGNTGVPGFLDDYASLGNALLTLHGATLERRWLDAAVALCHEVVKRFWDDSSGTVFDTDADAETLIVRPRDPMDNPAPSGSSLAAELLLRVARITAGKVAERHGLEVKEDESLQEIGFGTWESKTAAEILETDPEGFSRLRSGEDFRRGTTGETFTEVADRVEQTVARIVAAHPGKRVAVISHGGATRAFATRVLGMDFAQRHRLPILGNTALGRIDYSDRGRVVAKWNVAPHLVG